MKAKIYPGSIGAALEAIKLFGPDRVDAGGWGTPVYVDAVTPEELTAAQELLKPYGLTVEAV